MCQGKVPWQREQLRLSVWGGRTPGMHRNQHGSSGPSGHPGYQHPAEEAASQPRQSPWHSQGRNPGKQHNSKLLEDTNTLSPSPLILFCAFSPYLGLHQWGNRTGLVRCSNHITPQPTSYSPGRKEALTLSEDQNNRRTFYHPRLMSKSPRMVLRLHLNTQGTQGINPRIHPNAQGKAAYTGGFQVSWEGRKVDYTRWHFAYLV